MKTVAKLTPNYKQVQGAVDKRVRIAGILAALFGLVGVLATFMR